MPYLRAAIFALVPIERPGLNTMAVTKSMILFWDSAALLRWPREETVCTLLHEVWHVLRDHAGRCEAMQAERSLWNKAADLEINDDLSAAAPDVVGAKIGDGWLMPESFGLANGGLAEGYYRQLLAQQHALSGPGAGSGPGGNSGPSAPSAGNGWCGSGAGQAIPNEPDDDNADPADPNNPQAPSAGAPTPGGPLQAAPSTGRSAAEIQTVRKRVAQAVRDEARKGGRGRGSIPAGWQRWAGQVLTPPKVRWQDKFARAARSAIAFRPGAADWTYSKLSRRQAGVGFGPGRPILHATHTPVPIVDVWVDTSGSMEEKHLAVALRESAGVLVAVGGNVQFGAIDADVHTCKVVSDWREIPSLLVGGGGTDFRPAFERSASTKRRAGVIVFITDGGGTAPEFPPLHARVIWLLVGEYRSRPCQWGEFVEIDD